MDAPDPYQYADALLQKKVPVEFGIHNTSLGLYNIYSLHRWEEIDAIHTEVRQYFNEMDIAHSLDYASTEAVFHAERITMDPKIDVVSTPIVHIYPKNEQIRIQCQLHNIRQTIRELVRMTLGNPLKFQYTTECRIEGLLRNTHIILALKKRHMQLETMLKDVFESRKT